MSRSHESTVVVGGGIVGALCAWHLQQKGHSVTIVERDRFGAACSHGNCGYICPSHMLPLAVPGAIRGALKTLLKRNSPFAIKKKFSPNLWRWFFQFARRCNERDMLQAARGLFPLLESSRELYVELLSHPELACEWQQRGLLMVHHSEESFEAYAKTNSMLEEEFGASAVPYDGANLVKLEPALKEGLGGAWHYEQDMHLRPDLLMTKLRQSIESNEGKIIEGEAVSTFVAEGNRCRAVKLASQELEADSFVIATGATVPMLQKQLGCRLPVQPGKGYTITMQAPNQAPKIPLIFEEHRVAVTPLESAYRIGSTMEFAGYDASLNPKRLELLRDGAQHYLHEPYTDEITENWFGWRPMTYDSLPIIDRTPRFQNAWIAGGHSMLGLTLGAATGKLISEMVCNEQPHVDPKPFSVSRF